MGTVAIKKGKVHKTAVHYYVTYTACILYTTFKKAIGGLLIIISVITLLRECCVKPFNLSVTYKNLFEIQFFLLLFRAHKLKKNE